MTDQANNHSTVFFKKGTERQCVDIRFIESSVGLCRKDI